MSSARLHCLPQERFKDLVSHETMGLRHYDNLFTGMAPWVMSLVVTVSSIHFQGRASAARPEGQELPGPVDPPPRKRWLATHLENGCAWRCPGGCAALGRDAGLCDQEIEGRPPPPPPPPNPDGPWAQTFRPPPPPPARGCVASLIYSLFWGVPCCRGHPPPRRGLRAPE